MVILLWIAGVISALILTVAIIAISVGGLPRLLNIYADFDYWWSIYRPLPPEGEMYVVVKGSPNGPYAKLLESVPTHNYEEKTDTFIELPAGTMHEPKGYLARHGLAYVGFNRYLLMREVEYDKYKKKKGSTSFDLVEKERKGPSFFFQYNMGTKLDKVETAGNLPVYMICKFTVQMFGPRRALFLAGGWEIHATAGVQSMLRRYGSDKTIDQLRVDKNTGGSAEFVRLLTGNDPDCLNPSLEQFGIRVIEATFVDFDEVADPATSKAIKAKEVATLEGDAAIITATKKNLAADQDAERIRKLGKARVESGGEFAGTFAIAEAIPEFGGDTLVLGNVPGVSVPVGK